MSAPSSIRLGDIMATKSGSVDPSKFPDEVFDLYSIPAFDGGRPEVVLGSQIGSAKQIVEPGDVLLSKIVPHIRRTWVVGENRGRRIIASGEWIVFRDNRMCPHYMRNVLVGDPFHAQFMSTVSGVGGSLLRARPAHVANITVPLPPLPEQRRIAEILDKADALRAKRRVAFAQLDTLTQSIFLDMFGDPVRNEKDWPLATVSSLCDLVRGSSPRPQGDPMFFGGPVPRLMVADITRDGWLVTPRIDSLTVEGAKRSRPVPAGTVVMAVSGNIGLVSQLAIDACVHDGFVAFTNLSANKCEPGFLLALLHFSKALHEKNKAGAIFINLTTTDIKAMRLPLPPNTLQREFLRRVKSLDALRTSQLTAQADVDTLFAALQHRAFRGDL